MFEYKTKGTCSKAIRIAAQDGVITHVEFKDGCAGNTQGVARLVTGMRIEDAIERLRGIQCRNGTSCPDQLAHALAALKVES